MKKLFLILAATAACMAFANKAQAQQTSTYLPEDIVFALMFNHADPGQTMTDVIMYQFIPTTSSYYVGLYQPGYAEQVMRNSMPCWATITEWEDEEGYVAEGYELTYGKFTIQIDPNAPSGAIHYWSYFKTPWGDGGNTWLAVN